MNALEKDFSFPTDDSTLLGSKNRSLCCIPQILNQVKPKKALQDRVREEKTNRLTSPAVKEYF